MDVKTAIRILSEKKTCFDLAFADPPYDAGFIALTLQHLAESSIIRRNGTIILQHSVREEPVPGDDARFALTDQRRYGDTLLTFLKISP
jgi:16S rRNA G966 N2-methylase RsmD